MTQSRGEGGKFLAKSDDGRSVRSIRATDATWMKFGDMAEEEGITRADLLEKLVQPQAAGPVGVDVALVNDAIAILTDALTLAGTKGNAIKGRVKAALDILTVGD